MIYISKLYKELISVCSHSHLRHGFCRFPGGGLINLLLLKIIYEKPSYGYEIMDRLEKLTGGRYIPEAGALYTMLRRMEARGLVSSNWERKESGVDRRVYKLTSDGEEALKEGLKMLKKKFQLMEDLIDFYNKNFSGD